MVQAKQRLAAVQSEFLASHGDAELHKVEKECLHYYVSISNDEENLLKHKSRVNWLRLGDGNTALLSQVWKDPKLV